MPRVSPIQSGFRAGEISPLSQGQVEDPRYKEGLAVCLNYLPMLQGPKTRRPGTEFIFPVKDSSKFTRMIPFEFSTTQAYMLEFGNLYFRVFKNGALVTSVGKTITGITKASPGVVTSAAHGFGNGDHVVVTGVVGMVELNNREFVVANSATDTFTLIDNITGVAVDTTGYTAYSSAGSAAAPVENATPYSTADLPLISFTQSDDVLYLAHPSYQPQVVIRSSDTAWTCNNMAGTTGLGDLIGLPDGPYYDENISGGTTFALAKHVGGLPPHFTLTASAVTGINNGSGFLATDVGRQFRFLNADDNRWYALQIGPINSTTSVEVFTIFRVDGLHDLSASVSATIVNWRMGLWSDTDGWPSCVTLHEDRLVFSGAGGDPTRFDGSMASNYMNFSPTDATGAVTDENGYSFSLASNNGNRIRWMTSDEQGMILGTSGAEYIARGSAPGTPITATSINVRKVGSYGSEAVQATQGGKNTIFVQRGGRKIREMSYYYFDINGFRAEELTDFSEHITASKITYLAYQNSPQPYVWAIRTDGVLLAALYERKADAIKLGWSRQIIGGSFGTGNAVVEQVAVIPSSDGENEDVYVIVKRTINGSTVRYIEMLTQIFDDTADIKDAWFVDSGLQYSGAATASISGLNHLNGQTVNILADGIAQTSKAVVNGKIILDTAAAEVTVGLGYNSDGQKLRTDAGAADGTAMGKTRRTHRIAFNLLNTMGFLMGPDFDSLDSITLDDEDSGNFDEAGALFTGITSQIVSADYDFDNMICWRQNQPLPGTILGIYPQQDTQDRR